MAKINYLEQLVGRIQDAEQRLQLNTLAGKNPEISQWIANPETVRRADEFSDWARANWDDAHDMTHREWAQSEQIRAFEARQGNAVDINELNQHLGTFMTENKLVTQTAFDAAMKTKEDAFSAELNLISGLATRIPYLNAKYKDEFGEMFDPDAFVTQATEKGYARYGKEGLDKFYQEFTAEKSEAKRAADITKRVEDAKAEGRREGAQAVAMAQNGNTPTLDDGSPNLGHFQAKLMNLGKDANGSPVPVNAELGRGQIARIAANAGDQADLARRVN